MIITTREQRLHHVTQMRASFAIENMLPDAEDRKMQERYIAGEIDLHAMLKYATEFAERGRSSGS